MNLFLLHNFETLNEFFIPHINRLIQFENFLQKSKPGNFQVNEMSTEL